MLSKSIVALGWFGGLLAANLVPFVAVPPAPQALQSPQGASVRGAKVTFERVLPPGTPPQRISERARLLSVATERGETPSPFLQPGMFRASYEATVLLPARDRMNFRIEGRGNATLEVNGAEVLRGALRVGAMLETKEAVKLKKGANTISLHFESLALGDGQLRLFWSGSEFGFEPIAPEMLSSPADDADVLAGERLRDGMQLFAERRCARCHEFEALRVGESAFSELDIAGPDLRNVGARAERDWIAAWVQSPRRFRADATMPDFGLSPAECGDIASYLAGLGGKANAIEFAADAATKGAARFRQLGCVACHAAPDENAVDAALGNRIPLAFVASKWLPGGLVEYLQEPQRNFPSVRMPDLRLSHDDATQLAAFLLAAPRLSLPAAEGDAARGKRLVQKHKCATCHALDVPLDDRPWPRFETLKPDRGCLAEDPKAKGAPDHGFTAEQRDAVRAFLVYAKEAPFRRSPLDYLARHLHADRCVACHGLDGEPSVWARYAQRESAKAPLPKNEDPVAQGVPALTWTGSKLQPSWITNFVTGQEKSPRPWLTARMPKFPSHGEAMAAGLVREHGYGAQDELPGGSDAQMSIYGERLVAQGTGFGCVLCHALGDKPAQQVFEREGIELTLARSRLRHEYFTRWLADPPRLDPDSRMPKFADNTGHTAFKDVLGGDAAQQFEAIWQFLGTRRRAH